MVKALNDFFKNTGYTDPSSRRVRLGNIAKDAIPEKDFSGYIATRMTLRDRVIGLIRPKYFKREKYILDRAHKNNRLYKSCIEDGFIENVYENVNVPGGEPIPVFQGIRVSNKGGDLIHCVGFIEAYLNKYPTQKLIVYTIIGTLFSTAVLGAIITKILNFW
jgi:hypothetical protein